MPEPADPVAPPVDTSGLVLMQAGAGDYAYRPAAPRVQRGMDGKPAVQLVEAGTTGFLQLTAEWTVGPDRLAALATAIGQRDGASPRLSPAFDTVRDTALLLTKDGAEPVVLASGTASGMPPQTSQLAATLDAAGIALIRRALGGERGIVTLRYSIDAADPDTADSGMAARSTTPGSSATILFAERSGQLRRHLLISEADLADALKG